MRSKYVCAGLGDALNICDEGMEITMAVGSKHQSAQAPAACATELCHALSRHVASPLPRVPSAKPDLYCYLGPSGVTVYIFKGT